MCLVHVTIVVKFILVTAQLSEKLLPYGHPPALALAVLGPHTAMVPMPWVAEV